MAEPSYITFLTREEIGSRLRALSAADCLRLERIARIYARSPNDAADLLQSAVIAALERRKWRADLNTTVFLTGVMRSLAYAGRQADKADPLAAGRVVVSEDDRFLDEIEADPAQTPEAVVLEERSAETFLARLQEIFADDPAVLRVIEGRIVGESPASIRGALGLNQTEYESVCRRMLRTYQSRFDRGGE